MQMTSADNTSLYEHFLSEGLAFATRMDLHVIIAVVAMAYLIKGSMRRFQQHSSAEFLWCPLLLSIVMTPFISLSFEVSQGWDWFFYIRTTMLNATGSAVAFVLLLPRLQRLRPEWFGGGLPPAESADGAK